MRMRYTGIVLPPGQENKAISGKYFVVLAGTALWAVWDVGACHPPDGGDDVIACKLP
ncbi:hypothetical protein NB069_06705 [Leclercia adecarboxylata]|uniref:hypothetical protein n=1 Tax=Leclercia adecarboxylata TaxID=83655 RepID=UPI00202AC0EA|nr:hypothetical protein [Leclercia adecarboxylata]URO00556.1 hypothetical protein NB069_06705 [Leclercia adecarboxylata]